MRARRRRTSACRARSTHSRTMRSRRRCTAAARLQQGTPEQQRMAHFVIEEADRLARTVARYLEFARGDETPREHGDALAALDATVALLEGELGARGVMLDRSHGSVDSATV